jgi:hypothetical protein
MPQGQLKRSILQGSLSLLSFYFAGGSVWHRVYCQPFVVCIKLFAHWARHKSRIPVMDRLMMMSVPILPRPSKRQLSRATNRPNSGQLMIGWRAQNIGICAVEARSTGETDPVSECDVKSKRQSTAGCGDQVMMSVANKQKTSCPAGTVLFDKTNARGSMKNKALRVRMK